MKKYTLRMFFYFFALAGLFQYYLVPGVIWNMTFPFVSVFAFLYYIFKRNTLTDKHINVSLIAIAGLTLLELGLLFKINSNTTTPTSSRPLKVMTYNVFFKCKNMKNTTDLILKSNPDVVFIQELTPEWASILDIKFKKVYPFRSIHALHGTHGIGIYSKYKLSNVTFLNNEHKRPIAQIAELAFHHKTIQVINTHLASPGVAIENSNHFIRLYSQNYKERKGQLIQIMEQSLSLSKKYDAQLLIGDLNTLEFEPIWKHLNLHWVDAFDISGQGLGMNFPNSYKTGPLITIDYIMGRGKIKFLETKVIKGGHSDHLAIISKMEI